MIRSDKFLYFLLFLNFSIFPQDSNEIIQSVDTSQFETVPFEPDEKRMSSSQAFLSLGYQFLERKNLPKAREYFQKCIAEGDEISQRARIASISLEASAGKKNILSEVESLDEADKPEAYFMLADGWETYYFENPYKSDYLNLAKEYYSFLLARYENSVWAQRTRIQLASLDIEEKQYDFALDRLLPILKENKAQQNNKKLNSKESIHLGFDMAWFLLGRVLEESNQYKDHERAVESYKKVLSFGDSPFSESSEKRIKHLKKTFVMN